MKHDSTHKNFIAVCCIAVAIVVLVGMIYGLNQALQGQFHQNEINAERKIPRMVLPTGYYFDLYQGTLAKDVSACYVAANGAGIAVVVDESTSHGAIQVMVGVNSDGQVTKVAILKQEYTEGSDGGINDQQYLSAYIGRTVLSATDITGDYEIDPVPGATEASNAVYQAVKTAFLQQEVMDNDLDKAAGKTANGGGN